jgi:hypothetical protein
MSAPLMHTMNLGASYAMLAYTGGAVEHLQRA